MPIPLRADFDAPRLRAIARSTKDAAQTRRLLALAAVYDGARRTEAAAIGGVTLQIVRDWVMKFNAGGPDGLIDRKAPGQPSKLTEAHRTALKAVIESGPTAAIDGVVRWRLVDLCQWIWAEFRVVVAKQTLSRQLRAMGYRKLSARPRHYAQAAGAIEDFKNVWPAPSARDFSRAPMISLLQRIRLRRTPSQPRWRYAHSGPHKLPGVERRFLNQAFGAPFDCQAISISPLANLIDRSAHFGSAPTNDYAAKGSPLTTNPSPRRSTAQAILASLLANATMATLGWARSSSALAHRPSGVSRSATWGNAALAPWISSLRRYRLPRLLTPRSFGLPPVVN